GTKALHDAGITVVFSAGNDGVEMTTNVHSMAPWVIMSGSATTSAEKSDFSSSGLKFDNARVVEIGEDGHVRHEGDGLGLSHPDVSAPGSNIVSTCTPTGAIVCGATPPGGSSSASGTSMSAPHMAGLAALLLQAKPDLSPEEIRQVMQVTAVPMKDGAPLWRSGFGFVDALRAVQFVQRPDFGADLLNRLEAEQEAAALAARDHQVVAQDQWEFAELLFTAEGLETHEFPFEVLPQTQAIRASIAFPADLGLVGLNLLFEWSLNLLDPAGNVVASTELLPDIGIGVLHADFEELGLEDTAGTWTVEAVGDMHLAQPALLWGHTVTVAATQLEKQFTVAPVEPVFEASGSLDFVLSGGGGDFPSPEGCAYAPDGASGSLSTGAADSDCRSGTVGYLLNYGLSQPAEFVSEALPAPATVGGDALLSLYLADTPQPVYGVLFGSALTYQLDAIDPEGTLISAVASGEVPSSSLAVGSTPAHGIYPLPVPTTDLPANARLRLRMQFSGVYTSTMRLLWGGEYGDAGLSLQTGALVQPRSENTPPRVQPATVGGSLGGWAVLLLLLGWP
ncbi:MAG: S8 family serine peptidase, partial [Oceanococcaceae bacterium]